MGGVASMEFYISLSSISVFMSLMLAAMIRKADIRREYLWFVLVMAATATWVTFSIFFIILPDPYAFYAANLSYLGIIAMPILLLRFALKFSGSRAAGSFLATWAVWLIPSLSVLLMLTNAWHQLFWTNVYRGTLFAGNFILTLEFGPWYWVHTIYSYAIILVAIVILVYTTYKRKMHNILLLLPLGIALPLGTSMMFIFGTTHIDYTPVMLSFSCVAFGWAITSGFYSENLRTVSALKEKTESLQELYSLIVGMSENLLKADIPSMEATIDQAMEELGLFTEVDRVYIFDYNPETDSINNTHEWCNNGITPEKDNLQDIPLEAIPTWKKRFFRNEYIFIPRVSELPACEQSVREILEPQGVRSLIVTPCFRGTQFMGFAGFDSVRSEKNWDEPVIQLLRVAANILFGSIVRLKYEKDLILEKSNADSANRAKSEFLANLSHEIRTPLNAILGYTSMVADSDINPGSRDKLQMVLRSGHALTRLFNDLLELSRSESEHYGNRRHETMLRGTLTLLQNTFTPEVLNKGLVFNTRISDEADRIFLLDESRLRQALFNITGNAIKFTHQGQVDVSADAFLEENPVKEPGYAEETRKFTLQFVVRDTGIGIDESEHERIFESFTQVSRGDNREYEGSGLGLTIARRLIGQLGGTITLKSQPGMGSAFIIRIPNVESA